MRVARTAGTESTTLTFTGLPLQRLHQPNILAGRSIAVSSLPSPKSRWEQGRTPLDFHVCAVRCRLAFCTRYNTAELHSYHNHREYYRELYGTRIEQRSAVIDKKNVTSALEIEFRSPKN